MKQFQVKLMLIILAIIAGSNSLASGTCPVCLEHVTEEDLEKNRAYACAYHHCIDRSCLAEEIKHLPDVSDLESHGLACCGESGSCKERISLPTILDLLEAPDREALIVRIKKAAQPSTSLGLSVGTGKDDSRNRKEFLLSEGLENAFMLCCPVCGGGVGKIEGCNAAECQYRECNAKFCYLCLEEQPNKYAAYSHVFAHSKNHWETRPGFTERYHWILARRRLAHFFNQEMTPELRSSLLNSHHAMLEERNMWPMPAGVDAKIWLQQVREAKLPHDKLIELLQNEYIYLSQENNVKTATLIEEELKKLGATVLASLDAKDADPSQWGQAESLAVVMDNDPRVPPAFAKLGNMYQVNNVIWSGTVLSPMKKVFLKGSLNLAHSMTHLRASKYCQSLGKRSRLPSLEEFEALARALGYPNHYDSHRIPDLSTYQFWSSTTNKEFSSLASAYSGYEGKIYEFARNSKIAVRCVIPIQ